MAPLDERRLLSSNGNSNARPVFDRLTGLRARNALSRLHSLSPVYTSLETIFAESIRQLVANAYAERRTLDYKRDLPGSTDSARKDFLADVCSFANSEGGTILYGIDEERDADGRPTGRPKSVHGVDSQGLDRVLLGLDSMIRDGIDPRVPAVEWKTLDNVEPGKHVVALRIPRSWTRPHMVTFRGTSRFYARNGSGKYQLDVGEIKSAVLAEHTIGDRLRRVRVDRLDSILRGDGPVPLLDGAKIVLHLLPLASFSPGARVSLQAVEAMQPMPRPMSVRTGCSRAYNADGIAIYEMSVPSQGYIQVFRDGTLELVEAKELGGRRDEQNPFADANTISPERFEGLLVAGLDTLREMQRQLDVPLPSSVLLSVMNARGLFVYPPGSHKSSYPVKPIERDHLVFPDELLVVPATASAAVLRPAFDMLWQASGRPGSPFYDADGTWKLRC